MRKNIISSRLELHEHDRECWNIEKFSDTAILLKAMDNGEGESLVRINAQRRMWEWDVSRIISLDIQGIGGRVDGLALTNSSFYLLWLLLKDPPSDVLGFGFTKQPRSSCTITSGTKGNIATVTLSDNTAYQFTRGARVAIHYYNATPASTSYNLGTISAIPDINELEVSLDNETNYGTNLSGATHTIIQLDKFKPYDVGYCRYEGEQVEKYSFFKLLSGCVYVDSSGIIQYFQRTIDGQVFWNDYATRKIDLSANNANVFNLFDLLPPTTKAYQAMPYFSASADGYYSIAFSDLFSDTEIGKVAHYTEASDVIYGYLDLVYQAGLLKSENDNANNDNHLAVVGFWE